MKQLSSGFLAMLNSADSLAVANLYTFTLADGTVLRWTDAQQPLTVGANTYAVGPVITRDTVSTQIGVQVADMTLTISADPSMQMDGLPWMQAFARLRFDLALVEIDKFLSPSWTDTSRGSVNIFAGEVGDVVIDRQKATLTVNSLTARLTRQFPGNYVMPSCVHTLFDPGCTLSAAAYQVSGAITGASPTVFSFATTLTQADDYFALGKIEFLTGANAGAMRSVKSYAQASGAITLIYPLEAIPGTGDAFTA